MPPGNLADWVALNLLTGLGPILARRALDRFGDPAEVAYRAPIQALQEIRGVGDGISASIASGRARLRERAETEVRDSERLGIHLVTVADATYPAALLTLADAPIVLYVKGDLAEGVVRIAVVG